MIRVPLEGRGVCWVESDSNEDELRLRHWLRRTGRFASIRETIDNLLDQLDDLDERRAA